MLPKYDINLTAENIEIVTSQPSKTYKDVTDRVSGKIDNVEAVKQTINHILNTERYAYPIYPDWYGMEFEKYIGRSFEYFQATIEKDLKEALTQDDRIYDVKTDAILNINRESAFVAFTAYTTIGNIQQEASFGL